MANDVFGYTNNVKTSGAVASSEFAVVTLGAKQALVQNMQASYQQQIDTVVSVGDSSIYWIPSRPTGAIGITKLVGDGGFFQDWKDKPCGVISSTAVVLTNSRCGFTGAGHITFDGAVIEALSVTMGSQQRTIAETANIRVAFLSATS